MYMPTRTLATVVLAAGGSTRLGRSKQLLRRAARPLLLDACLAAEAVTPGRVVVVLGAERLRLRRLLSRALPGLRFAHNPAWRDGMAGSLRRGLAKLPRRAAAALVTLADQPHVDAAALGALVQAWRRRPGRPAAADYDGRVGVPAVLPRARWREVGNGDQGARALLRSETRITRVAMPEARLDLDTPDDAARLRRAPRRLRTRRRSARAWRS